MLLYTRTSVYRTPSQQSGSCVRVHKPAYVPASRAILFLHGTMAHAQRHHMRKHASSRPRRPTHWITGGCGSLGDIRMAAGTCRIRVGAVDEAPGTLTRPERPSSNGRTSLATVIVWVLLLRFGVRDGKIASSFFLCKSVQEVPRGQTIR